MRVVNKKISELLEYENNPRIIERTAIEKMACMIDSFGFRVPVIVKGNELVDGHLRIKAAQYLGLESVPCVIADDMTDKQVKAFRVAVNKAAELADWDNELLAIELQELEDIDVVLGDIGFDDGELENGILDDANDYKDVIELPELKTGDREPFQSMTFTLHDIQAEMVVEALKKAGLNDLQSNLNSNKLGNELFEVCRFFVGEKS